MNANPIQRPIANDLYEILYLWDNYLRYQEENFGYKGKEIKARFKEADKEIPNILASYKKDPDTVYTSRIFTFGNLSKPVNSPIITSHYLNDDENNKGTSIIIFNIGIFIF